MVTRKNFLRLSALGLGVLATGCKPSESAASKVISEPDLPVFDPEKAPIVLSTWYHGLAANEGAWKILGEGGNALDAVEKGVMVTESDPKNRSVGLAGLPDREGHTTLDACIMDHDGRCGSVAFLENIEHPIAVARKVMEDTPHVMLVGKGAYEFAREKGFPHREFLDEASKKEVDKAYQYCHKTSKN